MFVINAVQFGLGVLAAVAVTRRFHRWRACVLASAGFFLVLTALDTFPNLASLEELRQTFSARRPESFLDSVISSKVAIATKKFQLSPGINGWFFAYHWLVMPLVQLAVIAAAFLMRTSNPLLQPTPASGRG
jgi:hypothetical protein